MQLPEQPVLPSTIALFEAQLRDVVAKRGGEPDAMSAMFLLYRANTDTIAAMEAAALRPQRPWCGASKLGADDTNRAPPACQAWVWGRVG